MSADYPVTASETLFQGRVVALRRDTVQMPDGALAVREVVEHPGAVGVVALDEDVNIVLVNQYRHPVGRRLDELPAGLLDVEGESALDGAKRELAEEAQLAADEWHVLVDLYPTPGMSSEAIRIYLARGLRAQQPDAAFRATHEEVTLTVRRLPLGEAVRRAEAGELTNAAAVAGVLAAAHGAATGWAGLRPADAPWPARPGR
ncbi:MAG: NUDIX hydrolase [Jatrophihabitantaceae bacterium]